MHFFVQIYSGAVASAENLEQYQQKISRFLYIHVQLLGTCKNLDTVNAVLRFGTLHHTSWVKTDHIRSHMIHDMYHSIDNEQIKKKIHTMQ